MLPHDLAVSWSAIHKHFLSWARNGAWELVLAEVRRQGRHAHDRNPEPRPG
jgi:hypothetical protein